MENFVIRKQLLSVPQEIGRLSFTAYAVWKGLKYKSTWNPKERIA